MVMDTKGSVSKMLSLHTRRTLGTNGRQIPIHPALKKALTDLYEQQKFNVVPDRQVVYSMRAKGLSARSVQQ